MDTPKRIFSTARDHNITGEQDAQIDSRLKVVIPDLIVLHLSLSQLWKS